MLRQVREAIEQFHMIEPEDIVVAGVSGGADSVCLLLNLMEYRKDISFDIEVVHLNHLIRSEAGDDALFVRNLCDNAGIPYHLYEVDVTTLASQEHMSVEEAGRQARYKAYREVLGSRKGVIALGHHRDDLVETVIFNICRGSGIHGISGIEPVKDNVVRPLLYCTRNEIEDYLSKNGQDYVTDITNLHTDYTRNRIRLNVLPYLEKEVHQGTSEHIADMARSAALLGEYIRGQVSDSIELITQEAGYSISAFNKLPEFLKGEVILEIIYRLNSGRKDITRAHVDSIIELLRRNGEKRLDLPYNIRVIKSYDIFDIGYVDGVRQGQTINTKRKKLKTRIFSMDSSYVIPENQYTKWFDYDKIKSQVVMRTREAGDYLCTNSSLQKKSIKDYFIDEKIPKSERDSIPLIADGQHIIWVVGHRISEYYKIDAGTKRVIEMTVEDDYTDGVEQE